MRRCRLPCVLLTLALLSAMLSGCDSTRYQNVNRANYGEAEYKSDLSQCRSENSKIVMSSGYDDRSEVQVDEAKARSCMAARGWQPVSK